MRWTQVATAGLIMAYLGSTVFREPDTTDVLFDRWVGNLACAGCAHLCGLRAYAVRDRQRAGWTALTIALTLFALGNLRPTPASKVPALTSQPRTVAGGM